ncbi:Aldehyde dehydrogenase, C-terminal [Artemisia annua]|uniref:Aldehyde dehydrogenase, C-terminal n=1 Tax=Artemisia annua TaxID=35608 RepID=A0A2U1QAX1_ARTAN|nr:Aldehyde dehydrogenase, C-terminal [Artemisia annua]
MEAVLQSRAFLNDAKRIIIKVGTSVVNENDGRLAPERLGALCAQIQALYSQGIEVILVSSGSIGVGRQHLSTRISVNSSSADLQKPQAEIDRKACATVGQISIISLYNKLFSKLDLTSAQLLMSHNDVRSPESRKQLTDTVTSLLSLEVILIFNDNDAISTTAPYESFGIHWDNDSLAALLALELKADLLMFLSDVDGLYSGPPSDPQSKLIYTYIEEKHGNTITFGDKSSLGTSGMTTKVNVAVYASQGGIPVVITS